MAIISLILASAQAGMLARSASAAVFNIADNSFGEYILKGKDQRLYSKMKMKEADTQLLLRSTTNLFSDFIYPIDYGIGAENYGQPLAAFMMMHDGNHFLNTINLKVSGTSLPELYKNTIINNFFNEVSAAKSYHNLINNISQEGWDNFCNQIVNLTKKGGRPDFIATNIMLDNGVLKLMDVNPFNEKEIPTSILMFQDLCKVILRPVQLVSNDMINLYDKNVVSSIVGKIYNAFIKNEIPIYDINSDPKDAYATKIKEYMGQTGTKELFNVIGEIEGIKDLLKDLPPMPEVQEIECSYPSIISSLTPVHMFLHQPSSLLEMLRNTQKMLADKSAKVF